MDNQHKKIKGYRDLSQDEINLMNKIKGLAETTGELVQYMEDCSNYKNMESAPDLRWVRIAQTDLQKGFMSLVRSVAKPESF